MILAINIHRIHSKEGKLGLEAVKSIQEENKRILNTSQEVIEINVYRKISEGHGEPKSEWLSKQSFSNINDANAYLIQQDAADKYFSVILVQDMTLDSSNQNAFDYRKLEAEVSISLAGYKLIIDTDQVISSCNLDGARWKESEKGVVLTSVGNIKITKGKTLTILPQNNSLNAAFLKFEVDNNTLVLGGIEGKQNISFKKVTFDKALKNLEINGSFYYESLMRSDERGIEVTNTLSVYNRDCEVSVYVPMKTRKLELDGYMSVLDFTSTGIFKTNNSSRFCVLANGKAEFTNMEIVYNPNKEGMQFNMILEQAVELGKYKDYSAQEWEEIFQKAGKHTGIPKDIFEGVRLLSRRGVLNIHGYVKLSGEIAIPMILEKHYCWESERRDASNEKVSFSYNVKFDKKTVFEKGETVAVITKEEANAFSVTYNDLCLEKYGDELKAVTPIITVMLEGTDWKVEYESLQDAVTNMKTDFDIRKIDKKEMLTFIFLFKTDQTLTGNITLPGFVKRARFITDSVNDSGDWLVKKLDLNEYSISTSGLLSLNSGLQIISSGKPGTIKLTGRMERTGVDIYVGGNYYFSPEEDSKAEVFYPLQNVNILSANGYVAVGGRCPAGIKGNIDAYECLIGSNRWKINNITAVNLFVGPAWETKEGDVTVYYEEGRLNCDKLHIHGKMIVEQTALVEETVSEGKIQEAALEEENLETVSGGENQEAFSEEVIEEKNQEVYPKEVIKEYQGGRQKKSTLTYEKVNCNALTVKILEMHNGYVHVTNSANILDLFLVNNNPVLQVDGTIFNIKGNVVCGAANARLITGVNLEKRAQKNSSKEKKRKNGKQSLQPEQAFSVNKQEQSALYIGGDVEIVQEEKIGLWGDKITVSVIANRKPVDLRNQLSTKNYLLRTKSASENAFLADKSSGNPFDFDKNNGDSYILKKRKNMIEVIDGERVNVALYKKEQEEILVNCYDDINEAIEAIERMKEKKAEYIIKLRDNIGTQEQRVEFHLPKYAGKVTFISDADEDYVIYCKNNILQSTKVRWEKVRLDSQADYNAGKNTLELINAGLTAKKFTAKDLKVLYSDIIAKGETELTNLMLIDVWGEENTSIITAYKALTITDIKGCGNLIVYSTYTAKEWKKAVSQLNIKGDIGDEVVLDVRPCFYDTLSKSYYSFLNEEGEYDFQSFDKFSRELMLTGSGKPEAFKRLLTAKKLSNTKQILYYGMSQEEVWPTEYKGGIYFTNEPNTISVSAMSRGETETLGEFRSWEEAVRAIDKLKHMDWEYVINLKENVGFDGNSPLKKLILPSKAKRVIVEGNGVNCIVTTDTKITLNTNTVFSNILIAAVKKKKKGYVSVPYTLDIGRNHLLLHNMQQQMESEETRVRYNNIIKLTGTKDSIVDVVYVGESAHGTKMISSITNVGRVFFHSTEPAPEMKHGRYYSADYMVKDGIIDVDELILDKGVNVSCGSKDVLVKNLIMGANYERNTQEEMWSRLNAENITVFDNTTMMYSELKAGSNQKNGGKIKLNHVTFLNSVNKIDGKVNRKGKKLVTIKGNIFKSADSIKEEIFYESSEEVLEFIEEKSLFGVSPKIEKEISENFGKEAEDAMPEDFTKEDEELMEESYKEEDFTTKEEELFENFTKVKDDIFQGKSEEKIAKSVEHSEEIAEVRLWIGTTGLNEESRIYYTHIDFNTFEEAVKLIDKKRLKKINPETNRRVYESYVLELLQNVEIGNEKGDGKYKKLILPAKATEFVVLGNGKIIKYTGDVILHCNTTFENVLLTPLKMERKKVVSSKSNFKCGKYKLNNCGLRCGYYQNQEDPDTFVSCAGKVAEVSKKRPQKENDVKRKRIFNFKKK